MGRGWCSVRRAEERSQRDAFRELRRLLGVQANRTARSRGSGEYLFECPMYPVSQGLEPPKNPGRFRGPETVRIYVFEGHSIGVPEGGHSMARQTREGRRTRTLRLPAPRVHLTVQGAITRRGRGPAAHPVRLRYPDSTLAPRPPHQSASIAPFPGRLRSCRSSLGRSASGTSHAGSSVQSSRPDRRRQPGRRQPGRYTSPRSTVTISAMTSTCPLSSGEKTIGSYSRLIGDSTIRAWRQSSPSEAAFSDE